MSKKQNSNSGAYNNSVKQFVPDSEDNEVNEIEIIQKQKRKHSRKIKKKNICSSGVITTTQIPNCKKLQEKEEDKEFIEFVLGTFHDFHKISEIKTFKNMTSLTLIFEYIKDIGPLIDNMRNPEAMKYLCLNENELSSLEGIQKLKNLEELQVNFNHFTEIEKCVFELKGLKKFWICENKIEKIENLPEKIQNFWIANNLIKEIPEDFDKYTDLEFLNISGNFISDLKDIYILEKLPILKRLYISDINFGDNPICSYSNYRQIMVHTFKNIELLDQIIILPKERKEVENLYNKKNLYHINKIRQNHKTIKMIFQLMKTHKFFLVNMKYHQVRFFSQRQKMLEFAKYEKKFLRAENDTNMDEIEKEIDNSEYKVNNCLEICKHMTDIFRNLKNYISNLNDLCIVTNFYELETYLNYKLEPGNSDLKWVKSCIDLMKYRLNKEFLDAWKYKSLVINQIFKITNKKIKFLFDSLYDNLIDMNNKFGDEQKYFDFFFLVLPSETLFDVRKLLSFIFEKSYDDQDFLLCDNFTYIDEYELKSNNSCNKFKTIICKCCYFENMIEEINGDDLFFHTLNDIKNYLKEKAKNSDKKIIKLSLKLHNTNFYYYNITGIVEPEYIVEYGYEKIADNEDNLIKNNENGFISSFQCKLNINNDYETLFNLCAEHLYNANDNKIKKYFCSETINKNGLSKFGEFSELDSGFLFFIKNSVITYLNNCFKYQTYQDYLNEINKINEKIKEIADLKFKSNFLDIFNNKFVKENKDKGGKEKETKDVNIDWSKLTEVNLFNLDLNTEKFEEFLKKIKDVALESEDISNLLRNCQSLSICKNQIDKIDLKLILDIFPNLSKLDLSHNNITNIFFSSETVPETPTTSEESDYHYSLSSIDVSYNNISDFSNIITILKNFHNLNEFIYFANPYFKKYEKFVNDLTKKSISPEEKENIIKVYESSLKNEKCSNITIKINEDNTKINNNNKNFDYIYDCYSFNEKYHNFNDNIYFKEEMHKENHYRTVILSKKKLFCIPTIENKKDTQVLYINLNKITKITNLGQFDELLELYIQNNKIKKIENLPSTLKKLDISNNEFTDLNGIEKCQNLEWLNFENNSIKSVSKIIRLQNIIELYGAGNHINNPKECCQLGKLKKLEIIDLTGNDVCRVVRDLRITMIYYCQLLKNFNRINVDEQERIKAKEYFTGKLTSEVLEKRLGVGYNTFQLLELDLSSLKLKDEQNLFSKEIYPKLQKMNLSRNIFKTFEIFGKLPSLIELNLNYNLFTEIFPKKAKLVKGKGLFGLPNLESLEIAGNQIVDVNGIQCFKKLKILVLRENSLSKIDVINHMEFLTFLDVSFNKLRNCDKTNIGTLPSLQVFLCDNNYLKNINGFEKFTSVQSLSFENNKIPDFNSLEKLSLLENLKDLSIVNNPVTKSINYRNIMIRMFSNLLKLDNKEITNEDREMLAMEMQMDDNDYNDDQSDVYVPCGDFMVQKKLLTANYNYNIQRMQDKGLKRVNYVQIGYMMPMTILSSGPQVIRGRQEQNPNLQIQNSLNSKKTSNNINNIINNCNLPQIKSYNGITKPISSDSKKRIHRGSLNGSLNGNNNTGLKSGNNINMVQNKGRMQSIGKGLNAVGAKQDYYGFGAGNSMSNDYLSPTLNIEKFTPNRTGKNFNPKVKNVKKFV